MSAASDGFSTLAGQDGEPAGATNIDKIRDILFGSHMRDYDTRLTRLEETLRKEAGELRDGTRRRIDSLEAYLKGEFESLESRLKAERGERSESIAQVNRELKDSADSITRKIHEVADQSAAAQGDLRRNILQQSTDLRDEMRVLQNEITTLLEQRFNELRSGKTDRSALAALFSEVALKLNGEFHLPHE
jgi:DNA anti-recombination protein RmuC